MKTDDFMRTMRRNLSPILEEHGGILYSAFATIRRGRYYILGLNPGGAPGSGDTIARCLDTLPSYTGNAYLDEDWSNDRRHYGRGGHPLQLHLLQLMREIGEDLRQVCSANLIFTRSADQNGAGYPERAQVCWPVHEMVMREVRPEVVIAFGNGNVSPYAFLASLHHGRFGTWPAEMRDPAGNVARHCKAFRTTLGDRDTLVLGIPHLSRYSAVGNPTTAAWIKEVLQKP